MSSQTYHTRGCLGATGGFSRPVPQAKQNRRGRRLLQTHERLCRALCKALTDDCHVQIKMSSYRDRPERDLRITGPMDKVF